MKQISLPFLIFGMEFFLLQSILNTKAPYIRKSSLGRSRLICQSPFKCAGQIQNGGRFEFKKGKL